MSTYAKLLDFVVRTPAIRIPFKFMVARVASLGNDDFWKRMLAYSAMARSFAPLFGTHHYPTRAALWDDVLSKAGHGTPIAYVEFGVHRGFSIGYASERNNNPESRFFGLDSFEGLPENWGEVSRGTFSTSGVAPSISDRRVSFIKGWFQDTWSTLKNALPMRPTLIVHYDADLYSSTLFTLCKIDELGQQYTAIFDEFSGHECAALANYLEAYGARVDFHGYTTLDSNPLQVWCTITPKDR